MKTICVRFQKSTSGSEKERNKIVKKIYHTTLPTMKNIMKNDSKREVIYWNSHWLKKKEKGRIYLIVADYLKIMYGSK